MFRMAMFPGTGAAERQIAAEERAARKKAKSHLPKRRCWRHQHIPNQRSGTRLAQNFPDDYQQWRSKKEQMIMNGWCSHQVRHLSLKYDLQTFSYLATLKRSPFRIADHHRCALHENCVAYNTDPITYESRHTTTDCACSVISVPYESLIKIIRKGRVPLVSIESNGADASERFKLRVQARSRTSKYIAISHVWADGLGNPTKNGLPLCQIERLRVSLLAFQREQVCIISLR